MMCECSTWYDVITLTCFVLFLQIVIYKLGCKQGEKTAYKRFTKVCNVCRNKDK